MSTATPSPFYRPGDKVRIVIDEPYSTELRAGDVVVVIQQSAKRESDGSTIEAVQVATNLGNRWLGLDVIEPFGDVYRPAEPDEIIDAQLRAIFQAEPEMAAWARDADTALGAVDEKVSGRLAPTLTHEHAGDGYENFFTPGPGSEFEATDFNDDKLVIRYTERKCSKHGREAAFFFSINDGDPVVIPASFIGPVIAFLVDRFRFSQRPE